MWKDSEVCRCGFVTMLALWKARHFHWITIRWLKQWKASKDKSRKDEAHHPSKGDLKYSHSSKVHPWDVIPRLSLGEARSYISLRDTRIHLLLKATALWYRSSNSTEQHISRVLTLYKVLSCVHIMSPNYYGTFMTHRTILFLSSMRQLSQGYIIITKAHS